MTKDDVRKLLAILLGAYPRQVLQPETVAVYSEMLVDLDSEAAANALRQHIATSPYFPTVAEIRKAVVKQALGLPDAEIAWAEVTRQISTVGRYRVPFWSTQALRDAVNAIGWQELCSSENLSVERAHFFRVYDAFKGRAEEQENLAKLLPSSSGGGLLES